MMVLTMADRASPLLLAPVIEASRARDGDRAGEPPPLWNWLSDAMLFGATNDLGMQARLNPPPMHEQEQAPLAWLVKPWLVKTDWSRICSARTT